MVDEHGVDEDVVGGWPKGFDGAQHGEAGSVINVDAIDGFGIDRGETNREGGLADAAVELFALLAGELFGILQAHAHEDRIFGRKDDGGRDDWAEEGRRGQLHRRRRCHLAPR